MRIRRPIGAALIAWLAIGLMAPAMASAHAELVSSTPASAGDCSVPSWRFVGITSRVAFCSDVPATGMIPLDGMSSSAGAGKPTAIEPARWNPFAAEPE